MERVMGKRCACDRLLQQLDTDLRLRTLPMAAKMLWVQLMRLAASTPGFDGVLRFGSEFGFLASVSVSVSCAETELEPNLSALERRGLVRRGEDGESLVLPDAEPSSAKAEAARINGLKGGRRRAGETHEQRRERRQQELLMPLRGGAETQREPTAEPMGSPTTTTTESISTGEVGSSARETPGWVSLGAEIARLCGFKVKAGWKAYEPVRAWLEAGATPEQIRLVVRGIMEHRPPRFVTGLGYFTGPVTEAISEDRPAHRTAKRAGDGYVPGDADAYITEIIRPWEENGRQGVPMRRSDWAARRQAAA
jgi:hypothetical protein